MAHQEGICRQTCIGPHIKRTRSISRRQCKFHFPFPTFTAKKYLYSRDTSKKRVIRIMSRSAFDAHTDPLFKNLKILNLESIYKLQIGKFMYQCRSGLLPYSVNNMFSVTHQVHFYGTRRSEFFHLPYCRTNIRKFSISFQGPKFFNSLSSEIRNATSTASFCCKLKAFLLS